MIRTFGDAATRELAEGKRPKRIPNQIRKVAIRKLAMIENADNINDLRVPPGNHLEEMRGAYKGFHSIRINDQWRVVFRWVDNAAEDVSIVDYH